jgi:hypothetical protein
MVPCRDREVQMDVMGKNESGQEWNPAYILRILQGYPYLKIAIAVKIHK